MYVGHRPFCPLRALGIKFLSALVDRIKPPMGKRHRSLMRKWKVAPVNVLKAKEPSGSEEIAEMGGEIGLGDAALLDKIDKLRELNTDEHVPLPQVG